jgi:alpha-tubulin suppressor-like RCC1 family protein
MRLFVALSALAGLVSCGPSASPVAVAPVAPPAPSPSVSAPDAGVPAARLPTLAAARDSTCVVRGGRVWCFGSSVGRADAMSDPDATFKPHVVGGVEDAVAITDGGDLACALRRGGEVACWGEIAAGKTPRGVRVVTDAARPVAGVVATAVSAGFDFACAVRAAGDVVCWGAERDGQLGTPKGAPALTPVAGIDDAVDVAAAGRHACVRRRSGDVWCWGAGGASSRNTDDLVAPHAVPTLAGALRIASSGDESCAVRANGDIACVAAPAYLNPRVDALGVVDLAPGGEMRCGLAASGEVHCAGGAERGQLGQAGERVWQSANATVAGITDAVEVAAGTGHACALSRSGALHCWGRNEHGQLGLDTLATVSQPHKVEGVDDATRIAIAPGTVCAVKRTGAVVCWGSDAGGALGNGDEGADPSGFDDLTEKPIAVAALSDAVDIVAGDAHLCVIRRGGKVSCWGDDRWGQIGDSVSEAGPHTTPYEVPGIDDAVDFDANGVATCVARKSGKVTCWGTPPDVHSSALAQAWTGPGQGTFFGLRDVARVGASDDRGCAVRKDGTAACWGFEADAARDGKTPKRAFVELRGARDVAQIAVGEDALVLLRSGDVRELDLHAAFAPGHASGPPLGDKIFTDVRLISRCISGECVVKKSGEVACFADGKAKTFGIADAVDVASGGDVTCAVRKSGEVDCWGNNDAAECGVMPQLYSLLPVAVAGLPAP